MTFRRYGVLACAVFLSALAAACSGGSGDTAGASMDETAEAYVKLVLAVGVHDPGYVDAYYGPDEWKAEVAAEKRSLAAIGADAAALSKKLDDIDPGDREMQVLRHRFLKRQLQALEAYVEMLQGKKLSFDEESLALYDAIAPTHPASYFQDTLEELDDLLPGNGSLSGRLDEFRSEFVIPVDKLDAVFDAALDESRRRTSANMELPEGERFVIEYVNDKPWSGYNWYQGNSYSLIQINTDLPIYISRAIDLACHEGYPGHHVYNASLEQHLVRERDWVEFCVYPLFSPMSLIAEGSANYGIDVAFPGEERIVFERDVLFPIAGIDPGKAALYYEVQELVDKLSYAGNEAARSYLDGKMRREEAVEWLVTYALMSPQRADQRLDFIDTYRSYVINYNLGQDLVRDYIESRGGTADNPAKRWEEFKTLVASPRLPSGLR